MKQRDNYFSFMKGIAIIGVLFIHSEFMDSNQFGIAARQVATFAVALFFFVLGYFVKFDTVKLKMGGVIRLFIPYAIWSFLWFAETTITGSQPVTLWKVVNTLFFGGAFFPLYFLIVLMEFKLLTPWMVRHINALSNSSGQYVWYKDWALLITPITLLVLYSIQYNTRQQPLIYAQVFPTWFLMYYVGCLAKKGSIKISGPIALAGVLLSFYLMSLESTYIYDVLNVPFWAASQIKFSSFFYALALSFLLLSLHCEMKRNVVVRLGEMSFGIFLLHIPVKMGVDVIMNRMLADSPLKQLAVVIMTLFLCYVVLVISYKILPDRINRYLGFK